MAKHQGERADENDLRHLGDPAEGDGNSVRAHRNVRPARMAMPMNDSRIDRNSGCSRLGWMTMMTIAQTSSMTSRPKGDAAGNGVEFERLLEQFHDEQGRGAADDEADVERPERAEQRAEAEQGEALGNDEAEQNDQRVLHQAGQDDGAAALDDLADVHLQPDDEEQEHEAQFGDGVDVGAVGDQLQAERTGDDAGQDVAGDRRKLDADEEDREQARQENADAHVMNERRQRALGGQGRRGGKRQPNGGPDETRPTRASDHHSRSRSPRYGRGIVASATIVGGRAPVKRASGMDADCREATVAISGAQAPVAQLDRALPSEGRGREFESRRVRQLLQSLGRSTGTASAVAHSCLDAAACVWRHQFGLLEGSGDSAIDVENVPVDERRCGAG